jgi:hypothetical protein
MITFKYHAVSQPGTLPSLSAARDFEFIASEADIDYYINRIKDALNLLSSEDKWTQGGLAKDKYGKILPEWHPDAVCWCVEGAIYKTLGHREDAGGNINVPIERLKTVDLLGYICEMGRWSEFVDFNDSKNTTYYDVIRALNEAVSFLESAKKLSDGARVVIINL